MLEAADFGLPDPLARLAIFLEGDDAALVLRALDLSSRSSDSVAASRSEEVDGGGRSTPGVRERLADQAAAASLTILKSMRRPSRSTRLTCTRTRVPTP